MKSMFTTGACAMVMAMLTWASIVGTVTRNVQPADTVVIRLAPEELEMVNVGELYERKVNFDELCHTPDVTSTTTGMLAMTLALPRECYTYDDQTYQVHLIRGMVWSNEAELTRGGMLLIDEHYFTVDVLEDLAMELALWEEKTPSRAAVMKLVALDVPIERTLIEEYLLQILLRITRRGMHIGFASRILTVAVGGITFVFCSLIQRLIEIAQLQWRKRQALVGS